MTLFFESYALSATLRECWVRADNLRQSCQRPNWTTAPTLHALVLAAIYVPEPLRRLGLCRLFIDALVADSRFEMVIVEGVGNSNLAAALLRWGWNYDPGVSDFYWRNTAR